jgi:hypothetical protein
MSRAAVERYVRAIKLFRILVLLLWLVAMGVGGWQVWTTSPCPLAHYILVFTGAQLSRQYQLAT